MKKYLILVIVSLSITFFYNCGSSKRTASATASESATKPALTYESHMKEVISANCSPCHFPSKGGNKKAFDNYANVKSDIDEMIRRIELNPTDKGFMPFKKAKLSDSTIAVFKQWKQAGMAE